VDSPTLSLDHIYGDGAMAPRSSTQPSPDSDAVRIAWGTLIQLFLSQEASWAAEGERLGLTPPQIRLLMIVREQPTLLMRDLADAMGVGKPYVTALVQQLEASGHLQRLPSDADGRAKLLKLTRSGKRACAVLADALFTPPPGITTLGPADRQRLVELAAAVTRRP
jgi:DNA-binding MarR family transcriptional regulator